jgi:thiamine pyrophosphokinase
MTRIIIFANGVMGQPALARVHLRPTDRIFCADGGTRRALDLDLTPERIIGDFDSLPAELLGRMEATGVRLYHYPADKAKTDLELALELAIAEKPDEIMLVAALGGRLDQMLANILLLTRPEYASAQLSLVDGLQWATLLRGPGTLALNGQPGDTLSLIPLTPTVRQVNLTGVVWPLTEATLTFGSTLTISNAMRDRQARITIGVGSVLVIHFTKNYEEAVNETGE